MKASISLFSFSRKLIFAILFIAMISCAPEKETNKDESTIEEYVSKDVEILEPEVSFSVESPKEPIILERKDFKVVLSADRNMYLGQSGIMEIWIGEEDIDVALSKDMNQDVKRVSIRCEKIYKTI